MSAPQVAAQRLAGTALAPAGSQLVLAEWTAQGSAGDEPLYLTSYPVEGRPERLRHHLRRPPQRGTQVTTEEEVTPLA